jgi:putative ribosome biogenesis GTPase RsgA
LEVAIAVVSDISSAGRNGKTTTREAQALLIHASSVIE